MSLVLFILYKIGGKSFILFMLSFPPALLVHFWFWVNRTRWRTGGLWWDPLILLQPETQRRHPSERASVKTSWRTWSTVRRALSRPRRTSSSSSVPSVLRTRTDLILQVRSRILSTAAPPLLNEESWTSNMCVASTACYHKEIRNSHVESHTDLRSPPSLCST